MRREQVRIDKALSESQISPRFREKTFERFEVSAGTRSAFDACLAFNAEQCGDGLILFGREGRGKTHLAIAVANKHLGKVPVLFFSSPELFDSMRPNQSQDAWKILEFAKTTKLLVVDDLGQEKVSDWVFERLFTIVNCRYLANLPIIFTTNKTMTELQEHFCRVNSGGRIVFKEYNRCLTSRLTEMCRIVPVEADDDYRHKIRREKLATEHFIKCPSCRGRKTTLPCMVCKEKGFVEDKS